MSEWQEDVERLSEIKGEMLELLDEALDLIRNMSADEYKRARAYWYAHIKGALTRDHEYLGGSMETMEDAIEALEEHAEEEE